MSQTLFKAFHKHQPPLDLNLSPNFATYELCDYGQLS